MMDLTRYGFEVAGRAPSGEADLMTKVAAVFHRFGVKAEVQKRAGQEALKLSVGEWHLAACPADHPNGHEYMEIVTGEELIIAMNAADPESVDTAASVMSIGLHKEIKVLGCMLKADHEAFAWANVVGSNWVGLKIRGGYARITINDHVYTLYLRELSLEAMQEKAAERLQSVFGAELSRAEEALKKAELDITEIKKVLGGHV
jgi:hypothetical protein